MVRKINPELIDVGTSKTSSIAPDIQPLPEFAACQMDCDYIPHFTYNNISLSGGQPFNVSEQLLANLGLDFTASPTRSFSIPCRHQSDVASCWSRFVFITAADMQHLHWAMDAIALIQHYFNNHTIIYYDLSDQKLTSTTVNKIKRLCNVVYRKFNFSRYPDHVRFLKTYTWKPLLIHEMLREFDSIFYIDSSVRLLAGLDVLVNKLQKSPGDVMTFVEDDSSVFSVTHPSMYQFIPISRVVAINSSVHAAGIVYMRRTQEVYDNIVRWWALCALEPRCMFPTTELYCQFNDSRRRDTNAGCHRFDQSAFNILLAKYMHLFNRHYTVAQETTDRRRSLLKVARTSKNRVRVYYCGTTGDSLLMSKKHSVTIPERILSKHLFVEIPTVWNT